MTSVPWTVVRPYEGTCHNNFCISNKIVHCYEFTSFINKNSMDSSRLDDEHKLIARYAQRLAQEARTIVSGLNCVLAIALGSFV